MKSPIRHLISVPTVESSQKIHRRQARQTATTMQALNAMRQQGAALQLSYADGRARWQLTGGVHVSPNTVTAILNNPHVVAANDGLFPDTAQTFRWNKEGNHD